MEALRSAMVEIDAYYNERGIFQDKFGFGVSPALIVIDMAYGWTDPAYAGGSARLDAAIAAIQKLLPLARSKGIPVIYTTSPYPQAQLKSAADFSPKFRKWDARACEIDERVKPQPGEYVIYKEHASAFRHHAGRSSARPACRYVTYHRLLDQCVRSRDRHRRQIQ
jgi:maleamate amidohydrolase